MEAKPQQEHQWLVDKLTGSWDFESECSMGPDQKPQKFSGTLETRSIGGMWIVGEGNSQMPDGGFGTTIITIGYDLKQQRFVGTFIGSMMDFMWIYNGSLSGNVLTLDTDGPSFTGEGTAKYQDIVTWIDDDNHVMRSQVLGSDGKWTQVVEMTYKRRK